MSYFFSTPVDIDIVLDDGDDRQMVDMKTEKGRREKAPLYKDGESVKGAVTIRPKDGKRLEHTGIKVQFIGTIGMLARKSPKDLLGLLGIMAEDMLRDVLRQRKPL
jgi:vacuolar protein sorting-associated protein 26